MVHYWNSKEIKKKPLSIDLQPPLPKKEQKERKVKGGSFYEALNKFCRIRIYPSLQELLNKPMCECECE